MAKIEPIEATINAHRSGEPSWPSRQVAHALDTAIQPHDRGALERLDARKNSGAFTAEVERAVTRHAAPVTPPERLRFAPANGPYAVSVVAWHFNFDES